MEKYNPWDHSNGENQKNFGTMNPEEIIRMQEYAAKQVAENDNSRAKEMLKTMIPDIEKKARAEALKQVRAEEIYKKWIHISKISPFITETININGLELDRTNFIPYFIKNDPCTEDIRLYFNDVSSEWLIRVKNGLPKLISRFAAEACLIVDAVGPGSCSALSVFLKGSTKPLIFSEGIITSSDLRKQTQYHQKGLSLRNRDYYFESFIRAICMCNNVFFLTLPKHAGWNNTPDGRRVFVSAENMISILSDLFYDEKE